MREIFPGHFKPNEDDFKKLWSDSIFVIDTNVLLNLYRYSSATKNELEKALRAISNQLFIPHQAAKEFLKNRLIVTSGQAKEYTNAIKTINELVTNLSSKDRHPFIAEQELPVLKEYSHKLISNLQEQQNNLLEKFSEDEILAFVDELFSGKTGLAYSPEELTSIALEGELRYQNEVPPGFKDANKQDKDDPYRKFGDLIIWKQAIEHAKTNKKSVILITDDKKEDWWLEQSGRTIGPRPELIEEFKQETDQTFWMYTVDRFVQESAKTSDTIVSEEILFEIASVSENLSREKELENTEDNLQPSITASQEVTDHSESKAEGILTITLTRNMRYATGTGKFYPKFNNIPKIKVELIESPIENQSEIGISYGCGKVSDFNIHLKAKTGILSAGNYKFNYIATDSTLESE